MEFDNNSGVEYLYGTKYITMMPSIIRVYLVHPAYMKQTMLQILALVPPLQFSICLPCEFFNEYVDY